MKRATPEMAATESKLLRATITIWNRCYSTISTQRRLFRLCFSSFGVHITSILLLPNAMNTSQCSSDTQKCVTFVVVGWRSECRNRTQMEQHELIHIFGWLVTARKHSPLNWLVSDSLNFYARQPPISRAFTQFLSLAHSHRQLKTTADDTNTWSSPSLQCCYNKIACTKQ